MENYEDYLTEKFWEISSEMMKDKDINEIKKYILGFVRIVEVGLMKETYASGSYITSEDEDETYNPPVESRADRLGKQAWDLYLDENYDDAIYKINQALDFDDRHVENWNKKAIILEGLKMYATSENCYNKSLELSKRNMVYDNKARMLFRWAHKLLEESKDIPDGSNKLEEAKQKCIKAMKALPGENSEEDINQYLRLWDSINFYIGYERKFKRNIETLKKYDKSELFTKMMCNLIQVYL